MIWRVSNDRSPWVLLKQVDNELGRGKWWYGRGDKIPPIMLTGLLYGFSLTNDATVKEFKDMKRQEKTNNIIINHYQQGMALDMSMLMFLYLQVPKPRYYTAFC